MHGTVLRARTIDEKAAADRGVRREVVPLLDDGRVQPVVERVLPLEAAADAYELLAGDTTFGKVILDAADVAILDRDATLAGAMPVDA